MVLRRTGSYAMTWKPRFAGEALGLICIQFRAGLHSQVSLNTCELLIHAPNSTPRTRDMS